MSKLRGSQEISNQENILDSRDIIARISWLEGDRDTLQDAINEAENPDTKEAAEIALEEYYDTEEGRELKALESLQDDCNYGDWHHGAQLIHDNYFTQHAKELADDLGDAKKDRWPYTHIDWDAAADDLKQDYTEVDFDGETYWLRA